MRRFLVTSLKIFAYLLVIGAIALAVAVSVAVSQLPSLSASCIRRDDLGQMIRVRAADGTIIHIDGPELRRVAALTSEIPPIMRDAMVAVEDRRFRSHPGVDPIGIARALRVRVDRGHAGAQGGSTITQQLARNIFLTNDRTFGRKVREGILALALEWRFSKDQILELYLNRVYFGGGAYGIDAASRRFFGHSADRASASPRRRSSPAWSRRRPIIRRPPTPRPRAAAPAWCIDLMVAQRHDHPGRRPRRADPREVALRHAGPAGQNSTRYFTDWVLPQLDMLIDETVAADRRLDDARPQHAARRRRARSTPMRRGGAQGALVSLDRDGAVRAMVGGRDYVNSIYNRATQATRQPGSSFKLFVYLAAIEAGYRPDSERRRRADHDRRLEPAQQQSGRYAGPVSVAPGLRPFDQHRRGPPRAGGRLPHGRRHGAALRHHHAGRHQSVDGAGLVRRCG